MSTNFFMIICINVILYHIIPHDLVIALLGDHLVQRLLAENRVSESVVIAELLTDHFLHENYIFGFNLILSLCISWYLQS